ncbi:MAG: DUF4921 family protein [bacterium]|nr:DUF4921 family protein [bacterium]
MKLKDQKSELRKDIVSGEWVLVAAGRAKRPQVKKGVVVKESKKGCPFENPQAKGQNGDPLFWLPRPSGAKTQAKKTLKDWFVQAIPNKYPAVFNHPTESCPEISPQHMASSIDGYGSHEVVITRDHDRSIGKMNTAEAQLVIETYVARYRAISQDTCTRYVHIFHNHKREAGASIMHPHSQIISFPIVPPDINHSIEGSRQYFKKHKSCVHCAMMAWERSQKKRIVAENRDFIAVAPYASRVSFEVRIYPRKHGAHFERISNAQKFSLAEMMSWVFGSLLKELNDPAYNFFIHTTPVADGASDHYHWHIEILPAIGHLAGLELGTGIDVATFPPEEVASLLKKRI